MRVLISTTLLLALLSTPCLGKVIFCYYGSWASYHQELGKADPEDIDPTLCTHLVYAFVGISEEGEVKILDAWNDLPDDYGKNGFGKFVALKEKSPSTKTLVGIGGWNEGSSRFSAVANNPEKRRKFASNAVEFLQKYKFDGLDVDWEYPAQRGGEDADKDSFSLLLKELKAAFEPHGLLLTAAVASAKFSASKSYNIPEVSKYVDYINVMTYDLHGSWDNILAINAPLYPAAYESSELDLQLNADACISFWLDSGADPNKLVLGIPAYGRTFTMANTEENKPGSGAWGPGEAGPYSMTAGYLNYNEFCQQEWTTVWENDQQVPYAYKGSNWIGYDNVKSVQIKAKYAQDRGLAGVMFWSVDTEDFRGLCGTKFPLIKAAREVLFRN